MHDRRRRASARQASGEGSGWLSAVGGSPSSCSTPEQSRPARQGSPGTARTPAPPMRRFSWSPRARASQAPRRCAPRPHRRRSRRGHAEEVGQGSRCRLVGLSRGPVRRCRTYDAEIVGPLAAIRRFLDDDHQAASEREVCGMRGQAAPGGRFGRYLSRVASDAEVDHSRALAREREATRGNAGEREGDRHANAGNSHRA
jgi:hypothetical protein